MKKRLPEIDDIRGISIIVMIMIHTNVYYLQDKISYATLELSQFAVVAFIFCSAYLFYQKAQIYDWKLFFQHLWKRVKRLVIPYYYFLAVYCLFTYVKEPKKLTLPYFLQNIFVVGGIDFNWLVLLFIELAILMPFISYLFEKKRVLFYWYSGLAFVSSLVFLKFTPLSYYRAIMWLPWSLVIIYALLFDRIWKNKWAFFWVTVFSGVMWVASRQLVLQPLHHSLFMYDNKYPPNIYHLSYGIFCVNVLYLLSRLKTFSFFWIQKAIHFFSVYSYSIFFIHLLVIFVVTVFYHFSFTWITFYLSVTLWSVVVQLLLNGVGKIITASRH